MNYSEPKVTIDLKEYERLKDLEFQYKFILDKVSIRENVVNNPMSFEIKKIRIGTISKKDLDFFYDNLLGIEELEVK